MPDSNQASKNLVLITEIQGTDGVQFMLWKLEKIPCSRISYRLNNSVRLILSEKTIYKLSRVRSSQNLPDQFSSPFFIIFPFFSFDTVFLEHVEIFMFVRLCIKVTFVIKSRVHHNWYNYSKYIIYNFLYITICNNCGIYR